jgi:GNAT superfamily N-acetyltransferase
MKIENCSMDDFNQIISDIEAFWGSNRTVHLHQPYLIHEFGNTAFVIKEDDLIIGYLFGFFSQTEPTGYVHLLGIRESHQRKGLGTKLYTHFISLCSERGIKKIKAITSSGNSKSIAFHTKQIGMALKGQPNDDGIIVVKDYSGTGQDRVVFERNL